MSSFKAEFLVDGRWYDNAIRFVTEVEAKAYASDLFTRWTQPTDKRVEPSNDPPNYRYSAGGLVPYSKLGQALLLDEQKGSR